MSRSSKYVSAVLSLCIVSSAFNGCRQSQPDARNQPASPTPAVAFGPAAGDNGDLKLRYQPRKNRNALTDSYSVGANPAAIEKLLAELNQRLSLPFDISLAFSDCDSPNAFYDP